MNSIPNLREARIFFPDAIKRAVLKPAACPCTTGKTSVGDKQVLKCQLFNQQLQTYKQVRYNIYVIF